MAPPGKDAWSLMSHTALRHNSPTLSSHVNNELESVPTVRPHEFDLARRVRSFLAARREGNLQRLQVEAVGSQVILRGRLASLDEKRLALSGCRRVAGVQHVTDSIEVGDR